MWPDRVLRQFNKVPANPSESDFHGPYNKLLNTLFPVDTEFTVIPNYFQDSRNAADFLDTFEVRDLDDKPVFVLELKPPSHYAFVSRREAADDQIRTRLVDLIETCPLPQIYGVSALGTKLGFYSLKKEVGSRVHPPRIQRERDVVTDFAPSDRWDCDILDSDGEARFLSVVEDIIKGCKALRDANDAGETA